MLSLTPLADFPALTVPTKACGFHVLLHRVGQSFVFPFVLCSSFYCFQCLSSDPFPTLQAEPCFPKYEPLKKPKFSRTCCSSPLPLPSPQGGTPPGGGSSSLSLKHSSRHRFVLVAISGRNASPLANTFPCLNLGQVVTSRQPRLIPLVPVSHSSLCFHSYL